ncbi:uncharacterized protein DNG_01400 [Cephalotrichum gorgonifer]|uniref:Hyaluronan/mRNA-binding protein domain-containing protein n=1 Tax=Cephalotrichum gorgonifer TaxID=2041049 RepID=A0AAE8MT44_9PEZI|nr:uncharacterized protein DNG_01400 [Cephalotrichum gorgonifer]
MSVASKNLFDLLGEDGDAPAVRAPQKAAPAAKADASARPAQSASRRGYSGNEAAFRDRNAGADRNRSKATTDEETRGAGRGGLGARVRGGRGARHPRDRDDRHSKNIAPGSEKQAAQSWGAAEGQAELKDEVAGEEMARSEKKAEGEAEAKEAEPEEEEEKTMSYDAYLAQQAEKKLALEDTVQIRQANEGSKLDKKWAAAKPLAKSEDDEFISAASAGKARRERERKVKTTIEIDNRYVEPERTRGGARGGRGGRGGARGDRPERAPRGDRPERGDRPSRGGPRGERGAPRGGPRDAPRGGAPRAAPRAAINTNDQQAFPSLGGQ